MAKLPDLLGRRAPVEEQRTLYAARQLPHTMKDVAMMTLPVSVTIRLDRGSSSQRLAG
jgi:hypothetical protein